MQPNKLRLWKWVFGEVTVDGPGRWDAHNIDVRHKLVRGSAIERRLSDVEGEKKRDRRTAQQTDAHEITEREQSIRAM